MRFPARFLARCAFLSVSLLCALPALAGEHGESAGPPHPNWMYLALHVVNLAILLYILYRFLRKPVKEYLMKRQDTMRDALESAEKARRDAEELKREYEKRLSELDHEISTFKASVEKKGREEAARVQANAKAMSERIQADMKRLLDDELTRARHQLRTETVEIAFALAERLLRQRVDESDQRRLAEEYLNHVVQSTEIQ